MTSIPVVLLVASSMASPATGRDDSRPTSEADVAELWVEPSDIASRDLLHGPGGRDLVPKADVDYRFRALDTTGHSAGYEVEDPQGRKWKVKIGDEIQPEIVTSRILWAIGYHQPVLHLLTGWRLTGGPRLKPDAGRFRLESDHEKEGPWSWSRMPLVRTRPFQGLLVANLVLSNWDLKDSNTRIYRPRSAGGGPRIWYVVQDLGESLGKSRWPVGSNNDIDGFESQNLLEEVKDGRVKLDYHGLHKALLKDITPADVVWACRLLSRLSADQIRDAFRAGRYPDQLAARFIRKLDGKIHEGLALDRAAGGAQ